MKRACVSGIRYTNIPFPKHASLKVLLLCNLSNGPTPSKRILTLNSLEWPLHFFFGWKKVITISALRIVETGLSVQTDHLNMQYMYSIFLGPDKVQPASSTFTHN